MGRIEYLRLFFSKKTIKIIADKWIINTFIIFDYKNKTV